MKKDKKEKIRCICFLFASICFFIVSIVNFMDKNTTLAVTYLSLGMSFLLLSTTNLRKINKYNFKLNKIAARWPAKAVAQLSFSQ